MQPMFRNETTSPTQLHALIADLRWKLKILDGDIGEEEQKANIFDPANRAYPMLALTLRGRRDNLRATIAMLEHRCRELDSSIEPLAGSWADTSRAA